MDTLSNIKNSKGLLQKHKNINFYKELFVTGITNIFFQFTVHILTLFIVSLLVQSIIFQLSHILKPLL